jgi:hypothetical protein
LPPNCRLAIFARYPEPGRVKTRLAAGIGEEPACRIYQATAERIVRRASRWAGETGRSLCVYTTRAAGPRWHRWLGTNHQIRSQRGSDLGERMHTALTEGLRDGFEAAMCVGTDVPGLTTDHLEKAQKALDKAEVVVGPSRDGGYYLIGLKQPAPELFSGISWSTAHVLDATRAAADRAGLRVAELPGLNDVDTSEDLWGGAGPVSIVVPALNECDLIARAVRRAVLLGPAEVIVADGGSTDGTPERAREAGARVVKAPPGRGPQMNAGARAAVGKTLWFLHADCRAVPLAVWEMGQAMRKPEVAGGAFELALDRSTPWLKIVEVTANWRSRLWGKPYGDQGIFVRRKVFDQIGGFPKWPIMEDIELAHRIRRTGKLPILPHPVTASSRRWLKGGVMRTYLTMKLTQWGYYLGARPDSLARFYDRGQRR